MHYPNEPAAVAPIDPLVLGDYQVQIARGFASIRNRSSGEVMHSITPPMEEAQDLYVEGSGLAERMVSADHEAPLVLWDVGLGAAANAMAAVYCYEAQARKGAVRAMHIVSFENDLDSLRLALNHPALFPYLGHDAPTAILGQGYWQSQVHPGLSWTLVRGDFLESLNQSPAAPEVIFYDMFSRETQPAFWTLEAFRRLFLACAGGEAELFTYTYSTAARAAMLAAGFFVAKGRVTGKRPETTIALTPAAVRSRGSCRQLLGAEWLGRWQRSTAKYPPGLAEHGYPQFEHAILQHPQFCGCEK